MNNFVSSFGMPRRIFRYPERGHRKSCRTSIGKRFPLRALPSCRNRNLHRNHLSIVCHCLRWTKML